MKKTNFLGKVVGALAAAVMLASSVTYASESNTYTVYDDNGVAYVLNEGEVLGVLYDKYGNVKAQSVVSPRLAYVSGAKYTLDPGDYFLTYQYEPVGSFFAGFFYTYGSDPTPATTPGGRLKISIQNSKTIGGVRNNVYIKTFDTTQHDGDGTPVGGGMEEALYISPIDSNRPYYNARFENVCSKTITVCWCVGMD